MKPVIASIVYTVRFRDTNYDRQFVNPTDPRSVAKANAAIAQLLNQNLCDSMQKGFNGEIFRITQKGYDVADWLKNIE